MGKAKMIKHHRSALGKVMLRFLTLMADSWCR